jgi:hypothetical protein
MPRKKQSNVSAQLSSLALTAAGGVVGGQVSDILSSPDKETGKPMLDPMMANAAVGAAGAAMLFAPAPPLKNVGLGMASVGIANLIENLFTKNPKPSPTNAYSAPVYHRMAQQKAVEMKNRAANLPTVRTAQKGYNSNPTNVGQKMYPNKQPVVKSQSGGMIN